MSSLKLSYSMVSDSILKLVKLLLSYQHQRHIISLNISCPIFTRGQFGVIELVGI